MAISGMGNRVRNLEKSMAKEESVAISFPEGEFFLYGGRKGVPYSLRGYQKRDLSIFRGMEHPKMYLRYPRRAGKDSWCWPIMVSEALRIPGNYAYMLPDREQAAKVIWRGAMIDKNTKMANRFMDMIPKEEILSVNNQEKILTLKNGSVIYLVGASRPDSLRGINLTGIVYSEFDFYHSFEAYQVIQPVIAESKGWQIIISTPNDFGFAYKLFKRLSVDPTWYTRKETVETLVDEDNKPFMSLEDVKQASIDGNMPDWMVRREFYCEPALNSSTLYFAEEMRDMETQGRQTKLTVDHRIPVHFAFDLGSDGTPIIGFQVLYSGEIKIIFYSKPEDEVKTYSFYWNKCKEFINSTNAVMGYVILPHDSAKRQVNESSISSAYNDFKSMGAPAIKLKRVGDKDALINLAKHYLRKTYIDDRFTHLIEALCAYSRKFDSVTRVYSTKPLHDWSSHPSDCFQYLCQSIEEGHLALTSSKVYNRLRRK